MLKVRREVKDQKKNFSLKQQAPFAKPLPSLVKPAVEAGQDSPEWLISEDWALLQVRPVYDAGIRRYTASAWKRFRLLVPTVCVSPDRRSSSCWSCRST